MKKGIILTLTGLVVASQAMTFADTIETTRYFDNEPLVISVLATDESGERNVYYEGDIIDLQEPTQWIDGKFMVPVKPVLDKMGYKVTWNAETKSVDISKGAQFTTLYIGRNSYFKNKMAPKELSTAPTILDGRTYVPIEFFSEMLGTGMAIEEREIKFTDSDMAIHSGYVQSVKTDEKGVTTIVISSKEKSEGIEDQIIIHSEESYSILNTDVVEGAYINVISPPIMTLSLPGQATGYVIY